MGFLKCERKSEENGILAFLLSLIERKPGTGKVLGGIESYCFLLVTP